MPTGQSHNVAGPTPTARPRPWGCSSDPALEPDNTGKVMAARSSYRARRRPNDDISFKFQIFIWQYRIPTLEVKNLNIECRNSAPTPLLLCHTQVTPPRYHPETGWTERVLIILCIPIVTYIFLKPEGQHNFTCPKGKTASAEGRSPPQELKIGPRSGPYLLVFIHLWIGDF